MKANAFRAIKDDTVTITVKLSAVSGTYGIKYTSRSEYEVLTEGETKDDNFIVHGQENKYSISVSKGTRYFIYLKDGDDREKAAYNVRKHVRIDPGNNTTISNDCRNIEKGLYTFCATSNGTVTITTESYPGDNLEHVGTYAIKYTSRPEYEVLTEGESKSDEIIIKGQLNTYLIDNVIEGTRYFIYVYDRNNGENTANMFLDMSDQISSYNPKRVLNYDIKGIPSYGVRTRPYLFIAKEDGTVTITAASNEYTERSFDSVNGTYGLEHKIGGIGTYAIKYTTRPEYEVLTEGENKSDEIILDGQVNKYKINVIAGTKYSIIKGYGRNIGLKIYDNNGKQINDNGYIINNSYSFIAPSTGTVTITATSNDIDPSGILLNSEWGKGTGSYSIMYTSDSAATETE